jgi:hypothetical protein
MGRLLNATLIGPTVQLSTSAPAKGINNAAGALRTGGV